VEAFSTMVVSQVRHRKVSKFLRLSRDLLACMATPQSGQWRMAGADRCSDIIPLKSGRQRAALIQIKRAWPAQTTVVVAI
jgi:hypothetical protein